jgi:S-adenosylmethionine:tRNA ribosyltransferase-isomerase
MTEVDLFDYDLPEELIAATPAERRDEARLLVLDRRTGEVRHRRFDDLPALLAPGDLLVMNDARVIPARLHARRPTGGAVELLLVRTEEDGGLDAALWRAAVRSGGRLKEGEALEVPGAAQSVHLVSRHDGGYWTVRLGDGGRAPADLMRAASMPLPPYVLRARRRRGLPDEMPELDAERYQTVYARQPGAVAAPTAGLHFTEELLGRLREGGVETRMLSLMVGPGTFQPVRSDRVEDHVLEAERFRLPGPTAAALERARREGRRIVATGTTTCRVLEHAARAGRFEEQEGWTDLFIYPPFEFRAVGALITNFHLPRSTLLMLVAAFAGRENVLAAYREAIRQRYRFYSYGDAMFIA